MFCRLKPCRQLIGMIWYDGIWYDLCDGMKVWWFRYDGIDLVYLHYLAVSKFNLSTVLSPLEETTTLHCMTWLMIFPA